jgi:hypothetical protein
VSRSGGGSVLDELLGVMVGSLLAVFDTGFSNGISLVPLRLKDNYRIGCPM